MLKALAKRPVDRYATAAELAEDLARFLSHEPVKARRISPIGRMWRVARRHPGISIVTTTAAATILAIATFAYVRVVAERNEQFRPGARPSRPWRTAKKAEGEKDATHAKQSSSRPPRWSELAGPQPPQQWPAPDPQAVALKPEEPELRAQLRDVAVKFLVLRDVETGPELPTGRARGLVFGPNANRLAILSEDDEELALWDIGTRQRQWRLSLRFGSSPLAGPLTPQAGHEPGFTDAIGDEPADSGHRAGSAGPRRRASGRGESGATGTGPRRSNSGGQRLARAGHGPGRRLARRPGILPGRSVVGHPAPDGESARTARSRACSPTPPAVGSSPSSASSTTRSRSHGRADGRGFLRHRASSR